MGGGHSPEWQKSNIEANFCKNKKCDWEKIKKLRDLIRFHSPNKIDNYNRGGNRKKKIQKDLQNKSKCKKK